MNVPHFLESHVSQIPAIQLVQRFAAARSVGPGIEGSNPPIPAGNFPLVIGNLFRFVVLNRPSTPLNDAQLGGYFFARISRLGNANR